MSDDEQRERFSSYLVTSGIGFMCYCVFVAIVLLADRRTVLFFVGGDIVPKLIIGVAFITAMSVAFLAAKKNPGLANLTRPPSAALTTVSVALEIPLLILLCLTQYDPKFAGLPLGIVLQCLSCVLFGAGAAVQIVLWGCQWSLMFYQSPRRHVILAISFAVCLAGIACFSIDAPLSKAAGPEALTFCFLLLAASAGLCRFTGTRLSDFETDGFQGYNEFRLGLSKSAQFFRPLFGGFCIAAALQLLSSGQQEQLISYSFLPLVLSVSAGLFAAMNMRGFISIPLFDKIVFSSLCVGFALLPLVDGLMRVIVVWLILLTACLFLVQNWCVNTQISTKWMIDPLYVCITETSLIVIGAVLAGGFCLLLGLLGFPYPTLEGILSFIVVALFVVMIALVPYENKFWIELDEFMNDIESIPLHEDAKQPIYTAKYKDRCAQIAKGSNLSPRERDVFALLARGRDANIIARELFISPHTAKTHIYHIYAKLQVNSLQELIDMVESVRFESDDTTIIASFGE